MGKVPTLIPGGGGQGLVGVPTFGGSAGGISSLLTDASSGTFFVTITLLTVLDAAEIKGSSLLTFEKKRFMHGYIYYTNQSVYGHVAFGRMAFSIM